VITQPDKPAGRHQKISPPAVKKLFPKNLLIFQPETINKLKPSLLNLEPDLFILAGYGQKIPKELLEIPKYGCLGIHPSLLPQYRGPSPIVQTILDGQKETGVTIFKMDQEIDHGPVIASSKLTSSISSLNAAELTQKLSQLAAELIQKTLPDYLEGRIKPQPQNELMASYTKRLAKEDGFIEITKIRNPGSRRVLELIERKIRAFYPWPKVWTMVGNKRVLIHKAHIENSHLVLDIVQVAGKKPIPYKEYLKGNPKII